MTKRETAIDRTILARQALACLDLTDLADDVTDETTVALCERAVTPFGPTAAICIWPRFVATARRHLGPLHPVRIATVVNFPSGDRPVGEVVKETRGAIANGADEIDLVIPWKAFRAGGEGAVRTMISSVRDASPRPVLLKVILETGELGDPRLVEAGSRIALECGADFIKTSTGKVEVNATLETADIMLGVLAQRGGHGGFKPAGGIRTLDDAAAYFAHADRIMGRGWVSSRTFRFGASGLLNDILAALGEGEASLSGETY